MGRGRIAALAGVVAALAIAGCGEDREGEVDVRGGTGTSTGGGTATETTPKAATGSVVARLSISETDFALDPKNPKVRETGVVEFKAVNDGETVHALEVEGPGGEVETANLQPGRSQTIKVNLDKGGRYTMYCPVGNHRELGMEGTVVVAGGGKPAPAEPETETESPGGAAGGY